MTDELRVVLSPSRRAVELARDYASGMGAMQAVASTGALSLGTIRPSVEELNEPREPGQGPYTWRQATDEEWRYMLVSDLWGEVSDALACARDIGEWRDEQDLAQWLRVIDRWLEHHETWGETL